MFPGTPPSLCLIGHTPSHTTLTPHTFPFSSLPTVPGTKLSRYTTLQASPLSPSHDRMSDTATKSCRIMSTS